MVVGGSEMKLNLEIWIIHYNKLREREKPLKEQLKEQGITANWFIQKKSKPYREKEINEYYEKDNKKWKEKIKIANREIVPRRLGFSEIFLAINHFKLLKKFSNADENKIFLVLEDDVIFEKDFINKLKHVLLKLKYLKWDICFLDWCDTLPPKNLKKEREFIYKRTGPESWGAAAYLIKPKTARRLLSLGKFTLPADDELKFRIKKLNLMDVWVNPPLTKQASIFFNVKSSLDFERSRMGIKRYFNWRKRVYNFLERNKIGKKVTKKLQKYEIQIKKLFLK